jgi:hypothetical protein
MISPLHGGAVPCTASQSNAQRCHAVRCNALRCGAMQSKVYAPVVKDFSIRCGALRC